MKTTEIISGTYLLSAPVKNAASDRRSTSWNKKLIFQPGRYYVSVLDERREIVPGHSCQFLTVTVSKAGEHGCLSVIFRTDANGDYKNAASHILKAQAAEALVTSEAFQRDTSFSGFLIYSEADAWVNFRCVVERLVREGMVSEDAVARAVAAEIAQQQKEDEEEREKA